MKTTIIEVSKENVTDILKLRISEKQKAYIETTEQCLKDAKECKYYRPVGLFYDDILIGFAMYGFFPGEGENGRVWLDRFFIDSAHQGFGLGSIMLEALIKRIIEEYDCPEIYLSIVENNLAALHLYRKFGFAFNGESDYNNEKLMVKKV